MAKDYAKATFKSTRARRTQRSRRPFFVFIFCIFSILGAAAGWFVYHNGPAAYTAENMLAWMSDIKASLHGHKETAEKQGSKADAVNVVAEEPQVRFDFYSELPNMQVTLPATQTEANKNVPPPIVAKTDSPAKPHTLEDAHAASPATLSATDISESLVSATKAAPDAAPAKFTADASTGLSEKSKSIVDTSSAEPQYVVQVGAYKSDSTASEMRVSILLAGFDVTIVKTKVGDQTVYRIQQGPYSSMARAKAAQKKLQSKGFDGVVQKIS